MALSYTGVKMKKLPKSQFGQALLIILLVMAVGLTISLGLLFRTTADIKISRQFEESARALSAAEAGVEEGLRILSGEDSGTVAPGVSYKFVVSEAGEGEDSFSLGKILKGSTGTVWLAEYDSFVQRFKGDSITLCWQRADGIEPDLEAIVLYQEGSEYKVKREVFLHGSGLSGSENCGDSDGSKYPNKVDLSLPSASGDVLLALRLKPIGGDAYVAVDPPNDHPLPSQGKEVISTGRAGDTVRKVRAIKPYPSWPEIFDYVLFSGGELIK